MKPYVKSYSKVLLFVSVAVFLTLGNAVATDSQSRESNIQVNRQTSGGSIAPLDETPSDFFDEMEQMQAGFNQLLRESWKRMKNYQQAGKFFEPDADFVEQEGKYVLRMDLPGMEKNEIHIETTESAITISGERNTERQMTSQEGVSQFERSSGSFYRRMSLPSDADTEQIAATYENGVLEVTLPKVAPEKTEKKKVPIQ